ncbi:MAG TPA: glutaredoxin domain-containing protein [Myxococcota bacterium]|nr:glutaredoxin domain-containing protein [Myxococcota bacterium]
MKNIEVYTIDNCGYCEAAKKLLKEKGLSFKETNITGDQNQIKELINKTGHRTLPQIFIDGKFIGGFQELRAHLAAGN